MTPPAISIPVSKEVTSKNSRSCTCKDASPERMTTKMNSASHNRTRGEEWRSSGSSRFSEKPTSASAAAAAVVVAVAVAVVLKKQGVCVCPHHHSHELAGPQKKPSTAPSP